MSYGKKLFRSSTRAIDAQNVYDDTEGKLQNELNAAAKNKILYFQNQAVIPETPGQIMRIPASGTDSRITTDTVVLDCVFANPEQLVRDEITWTSYSGYVAFTGTCMLATTANVVLGTKGN